MEVKMHFSQQNNWECRYLIKQMGTWSQVFMK